jgi:PucR family transcriptional regulator, purine catabolism regulatory protein
MSITLGDVLEDPTLAPAEPIVLAGRSGLDGPVRWVHTSEVLEIAHLLRGGELLLVGGITLATAMPTERAAYLQALADRRIAGLAIETGPPLASVPAAMVEQAERLGLPLVEFRQVVPFVEVTEAINGRLINESVRRLRLGDQVSRTLLAVLSDGGDITELLQALSEQIGADAELVALSGQLLAWSESDRPRSDVVTAPVVIAGGTVATLVLFPGADTEPAALSAAQDRAPEVLGLALQRSHPASQAERDAREFLTLARSDTPSPQRLREVATRLAIMDQGPYVSIMARFDHQQLRVAALETALRSQGRRVISYVHEESYLAVATLAGNPVEVGRAAVIAALTRAPLPHGLRVAVGPGSRTLLGLTRCLREAERCFAVAITDSGDLIDAADLRIERFLHALAPSAPIIAEFVEEQLADLLTQDAAKRGIYFGTLASYVRHWGNKTQTAADLHLQRQSLYQRLARVFELTGNPTQASPRLAALTVAVELEAARRRGSTV